MLRAKGGKSLKVEVKQEKADESGSDKGFFIVHKGKEYRYREDIINILCIGVDKEISMEEKEAEAGRLGLADVIVLVSIDRCPDGSQGRHACGEKGNATDLSVCVWSRYGSERQADDGYSV